MPHCPSQRSSMSLVKRDENENFFFQYKDAFFTANPNFKWYKLPAPPLRTLTTRPCNMSPNQDYIFDFPPSGSHYDDYVELPTTPLSRQRHDSHMSNGKPTSKSRKSSGGVGQFKFADETQMGGLSSLMNDGGAVQADEGECSYCSFRFLRTLTLIQVQTRTNPSKTPCRKRRHFSPKPFPRRELSRLRICAITLARVTATLHRLCRQK